MTLPVLIHPGFVKTATTSLQRNLLATHPSILHLGRPAPWEELERAIHIIAHSDSTVYDEAAVRRVLTVALAETKGRRIVTLSNENFALYEATDRRVVAERLARLFPQAEIFFTIRRQDDLLAAWYLQKLEKYLKGGHFVPFSTWIAMKVREPHKSIFSDLDFWPVVRTYQDIFGHDRVHVLLFEELRQDPAAFAARLAQLLRLPPAEVHAALTRRVRNPTLTREYLAIMRLLGQISPPFLARKIGNRLVHLPGRRLRVDLDSATRQLVWARCAEGNAALARTFGLDLARFGYPLPEDTPTGTVLTATSSGR